MSGTTDIELPTTMEVETPQDDAPREHQPSAREITMAAINARRQEVLDAELAQGEQFDADARAAGLVYPEDEPETTTAPEAREPVARVSAPPTAGHPSGPAPQPLSGVREIQTPQGQRVQVTQEQYDQLAQLGMVANIALHTAPELPPVAPQPAAPQKTLVDDDRVRETVRQIQFGGEEAAVPALRGLIEDVVSRVPAGPQVDAAQIQAQAVDAAMARIQFMAQQEMIRGEFPDIFANPQLTKLAAINVDSLRNQYQRSGIPRNDLDIYREAGYAVYDALGKPRPGSDVAPNTAPQAATVSPRNEVVDRKRAAPRNPQVIDRRAAAPETQRAPTGTQIVEAMRKARGQSSMM